MYDDDDLSVSLTSFDRCIVDLLLLLTSTMIRSLLMLKKKEEEKKEVRKGKKEMMIERGWKEWRRKVEEWRKQNDDSER